MLLFTPELFLDILAIATISSLIIIGMFFIVDLFIKRDKDE